MIAPLKTRLELEWVRAISHPLRIAILEVLYEKDASPKEVGELLGVHLTHVSYHCRSLVDGGYLEEVRKVKRRNTYEHFFRATAESSFGHQRWRSVVPRALRGHSTAEALSSFMRVAVRALQSGAIDGRDDTVLNWMPLTVDSIGWKKATEVLRAAQGQLELIHDESRERLAASPESPTHIAAGLAAFELAPSSASRNGGRR
jgi:DNA-binding transcriptional ArsR family regulator